MGQEDLETVRINVYAALSIGAIGFPLSVAAFYSNVRRYNRSAASQPGGKWTRFQTIMMYALLLQIVGAGLSIVTLIATWMFNPSRLAIPVACATVDFNSGSRNVGIWVLELGWQLCLQAGGFTYFYIVMNRYSVFRMHIPGS
ncbi:hypothetical protein BJ742DRAFT_432187 [Cladochytrium replicatum]|nr:hypothetical protein BJ742DRAFT_432187 [Cladochytrium replicatum]